MVITNVTIVYYECNGLFYPFFGVAYHYKLGDFLEEMKYIEASDLDARMREVVLSLGMDYVDLNRVKCFRSLGSSTKRTIARCHTIGKLMQKAIGVQAWYAIEFLEPFEKLSPTHQDEVIIHELMHIPKTFGGGFRHHDFVCERNVKLLNERYQNMKKPSI